MAPRRSRRNTITVVVAVLLIACGSSLSATIPTDRGTGNSPPRRLDENTEADVDTVVPQDDAGAQMKIFQAAFKPIEPLTDQPAPTKPEDADLVLQLPTASQVPTKTSTEATAVRSPEPTTWNPTETTPTKPKTPTPTATSIPTPTTTNQIQTVTVKPLTTNTAASLTLHRSEHTRLHLMQTQLTKQLIEAQVLLQLIDLQIKNELHVYENAHATHNVRSAMPSPRGTGPRTLSCRGWKKTNQCRFTGSRHPEQDKSCFTPVTGGAAGYCEVRDDDTGEFFKVMRTNCTSVPVTTTLWCQLAPQFANLPAKIERVMADTAISSTKPTALSLSSSNAIVVVVLPSQIPQTRATITALRRLGCRLPIELWYFESEMLATHMATLQALAASDPSIVHRPLHTLPYTPDIVPFAKVHAIAHSAYANVLYLDVASVLPLRDPTYLFTLREFQSSGALFWPDVFHPGTTESNLQSASLLWELLDLAFVRMFEQDDRQLLVKRDSPLVQIALRVLAMLSTQRPNLFDKLELLKQSKDVFRLVWLKTKTPFHWVGVPPTLGGRMIGIKTEEGEEEKGSEQRFCGTHVVQHDPRGRVLFVHRYTAGETPEEKEEEEEEEEKQLLADVEAGITHVQTFERTQDQDRMLFDYDVRSFTMQSETHTNIKCFAHAGTSVRYTTRLWTEFREAIAK